MTVSISSQITVQMATSKVEATGDPTAPSIALPLNLQTVQPAAFSKQYAATTTPAGQDAWSGHIALTAGAATIDLTNLTQAGLTTVVNATGMKLRAIQVVADATNANPIQIGTGASNGYSGAGVISNLNAGDSATFILSSSINIDSTHKNLDLAGTGTQGCSVHMIFG